MNLPPPVHRSKSLSAQTGKYTHTGSSVIFRWSTAHILPADPVVLQALVTRETQVEEGFLVRAIEPAWAQIAALIAADPDALFKLTPQQLEELVAASYDKAGFDEVVLTPRSGDFGRDVIAVRKGWGSVRIVDQVKCFKPGHLVTANDVRALLGVLHSDPNATKGIVTTSSQFAPRIEKDPLISPQVPFRLELVDGPALRERLKALQSEK
jgi:restriction system protein